MISVTQGIQQGISGMASNQDFVTKEDIKSVKEEILNQFRVISEDVISHVRAVADGVLHVDEKLDRHYAHFRNEIGEKSKEVLAAVKFSYAELDKRLTTLERDFLELKVRIEKVENRNIS